MLQDTQQVLFRACGFKRDDHVCQEPTLNVFENATCVYHITLPAQPHNNLDVVCFVHYNCFVVLITLFLLECLYVFSETVFLCLDSTYFLQFR